MQKLAAAGDAHSMQRLIRMKKLILPDSMGERFKVFRTMLKALIRDEKCACVLHSNGRGDCRHDVETEEDRFSRGRTFEPLNEDDLRAAAVFFTGRPFALTDARTLNVGWSALMNADPADLRRLRRRHPSGIPGPRRSR